LYVDPDFVDLVDKEPTEGRGQLLAEQGNDFVKRNGLVVF